MEFVSCTFRCVFLGSVAFEHRCAGDEPYYSCTHKKHKMEKCAIRVFSESLSARLYTLHLTFSQTSNRKKERKYETAPGKKAFLHLVSYL